MRPDDRSLYAELVGHFVGTSPSFQRATKLIGQFARSRAPILIVGETGTGKELAAHAAHYLSDRSEAAFIPINCGALPDALIESELFGHARGAFTDANRAHAGLVSEAEGGTLFLDEVEALSPRGQVILLRFLQDSSFRPVGEQRCRRANVRIISASNVDLQRLVQEGSFRPDLLFRLDVLSIALPPLRERREDIALLVPHLLAKAAHAEGGDTKTVSPEALELLCAHDWPGNVRELEHLLLRAHLLTAGSTLARADLMSCSSKLADEPGAAKVIDRTSLREERQSAIREVERRFVERALMQSNGNISQAARLCNMERAVLSKMVKRYCPNLSRPAIERPSRQVHSMT